MKPLNCKMCRKMGNMWPQQRQWCQPRFPSIFSSRVRENLAFNKNVSETEIKWLLSKFIQFDTYIYLINQARGPYWENICPRSWQYGPSAARSVQKRPRADILPVRSRASLVIKGFITRLETAFKDNLYMKIATRKISWKQCAAKILKNACSSRNSCISRSKQGISIHSGVLQWFLRKISFVLSVILI